jgi:hypothetical protein
MTGTQASTILAWLGTILDRRGVIFTETRTTATIVSVTESVFTRTVLIQTILMATVLIATVLTRTVLIETVLAATIVSMLCERTIDSGRCGCEYALRHVRRRRGRVAL